MCRTLRVNPLPTLSDSVPFTDASADHILPTTIDEVLSEVTKDGVPVFNLLYDCLGKKAKGITNLQNATHWLGEDATKECEKNFAAELAWMAKVIGLTIQYLYERYPIQQLLRMLRDGARVWMHVGNYDRLSGIEFLGLARFVISYAKTHKGVLPTFNKWEYLSGTFNEQWTPEKVFPNSQASAFTLETLLPLTLTLTPHLIAKTMATPDAGSAP